MTDAVPATVERGCAQPALDMFWRHVGRFTLVERYPPLPIGTACSTCGSTDIPVWQSATYGTMCEAMRSVAAKRPGTKNQRPDGTYPERGGTAIAEAAAARASTERPVLVASVPLVMRCAVNLRPAWTPVPMSLTHADRLVAETLLDPPPPPFVLVRFGQKLPDFAITEDVNQLLLCDPGRIVALSRRRLLAAAALVRDARLSRGEVAAFQRWFPSWRLCEASSQQSKAATVLRDRVGPATWRDLIGLVPGSDDVQARWLDRLLAIMEEG